jgi:hypothetical protein
MTLAGYASYSGRDFSNADPHFKDEFNLDLQEPSLLLLSNEKTLPEFITKVILNVPTNHLFVDIIGTTFMIVHILLIVAYLIIMEFSTVTSIIIKIC